MRKLIRTQLRRGVFLTRAARARLPERLGSQLLPRGQRYSLSDVPQPIEAPDSARNVYLGPVNFAHQAWSWARALDALDYTSARNMQYRTETDFGFPSDYSVSESVYRFSRRWGKSQAQAVADGYTDVLNEAVRPMFGAAFDHALLREVNWLRQQGIEPISICHGTDIRLPSRHVEIDRWSPFRSAPPEWREQTERRARATRNLLRFTEMPVLVSTPDLLLDWPEATWLPLAVTEDQFASDAAPFQSRVPLVVHAPTNSLVKGTQLIEPTVFELASEGVLEYERLISVPSSDMPSVFKRADVVLEQFALGMYSVTAVEAMAAGRLVIGHIHEQVREHVRDTTGLEVPVLEANAGNLEEILRDVSQMPDKYRSFASRGPEFVSKVHSGALSAAVLENFLTRSGS